MRLTTCPDCGEAVELPLSRDDADVEVTCPICGLCGPVEEWWQFEPEDNNTLLGRNLADATIPASVPKRWALRVEQLEEIREVVAELQHQIRLLRQALDELNENLPACIKRWFDTWHSEYLPAEQPPAESPPVPVPAAPAASITETTALSLPSPTKSRPKSPKRAATPASTTQSGLWG